MTALRRSCPRDHSTLQPLALKMGSGATIDECAECHGIFLDKNELAKLTGDRALNSYLRDDVGFDSDSQLICPGCGGVMDAETVHVDKTEPDAPVQPGTTVVVDVCLTCFGLWLDKGELDVLRARANKAPVVRAAGKDEELAKAVEVRRRLVVQEGGAQGRGVGGAVRRRFVWLDNAMDELVRRYL